MKFEEWLSQQNGVIEVDCGCVTTEAFYHWMRVAYEAGNSPVIPGAEQRIADAVELLKQAAPAMLADNSGHDGPLAGRLKSPVIPEGYAMVPREPTAEMVIKMRYHVGGYDRNIKEGYKAMLAVDPQSPGSEPAIVPGKWIPVSEKIPGHSRAVLIITTLGEYWTGYFDRAGVFWCDEVKVESATHWQPLPEPPQEEKP